MTKRQRFASKRVLGSALRTSSPLGEEVRPGLQALESADKKKIHCTPSSFITDSLALDRTTSTTTPNAPRWDYIIGTKDPRDTLIGVEVHPARFDQIKHVIEKKRTAKQVMEQNLRSGKRVCAWYWIASGKTPRISKTSRTFRQLAKSGITLVGGQLQLPRPSR
ncbi:MAG: hypothetical protein AAGC55_28985 [Myxococcota bacterium]